MKYSSVFNEIYNNLNDGKVYATWIENVRFPMYWTVLQKITGRNGKELIEWRNAGSSCNGFTKKDLAWILETIFETTPEQFTARYECITEYERSHAIHGGVSYENVDNGYTGTFYNM